MESGVQLMSSQYPQSHGIRQMYPDRETVEATKKRIVPLAGLLRERGYDTAAIGDWCAGYYEVMPLGFEHISVSSFDNFKIYMSQAVVMAHFVVPLYFDNPLGYRIFPQLQAFAQFVTPKVVTERVEKRLEAAASEQQAVLLARLLFLQPPALPQPGTLSSACSPIPPIRDATATAWTSTSTPSSAAPTSNRNGRPCRPRKSPRSARSMTAAPAQFDDCVGKILAALERNGLADNTIVIITADHGDDLYEPGVTLGHGLTFNGGLQANHVPMIVHVPGTQPAGHSGNRAPHRCDSHPRGSHRPWKNPPPGRARVSPAGSAAPRPRNTARFMAKPAFPSSSSRVPGVERPKLPPMDECTWIDEDYNYQFVLKPEYRDRLVAGQTTLPANPQLETRLHPHRRRHPPFRALPHRHRSPRRDRPRRLPPRSARPDASRARTLDGRKNRDPPSRKSSPAASRKNRRSEIAA